MHGAHPAALELSLQAEVEVRRINADERIGLPLQQAPAQARAQREQARQVREHLAQSHHREFGSIVPGVQARVAHRRPAHAGEQRTRKTPGKLADQPRAQLVPRRLAGDQRETRRTGLGLGHRSSARWPESMNSSIARTSSLSPAISARRSRAWARSAPDMYRAR